MKWCANEADVPIPNGHVETQRVGASARGTRKFRARAQVVETDWELGRQKSDKSNGGVRGQRTSSGV